MRTSCVWTNRYTQNSGTGPAYSNMCVRATKKNATGHDVPQNFIGDGRYHNYTIVWHTGGHVVQRTAPDGTTTSTEAGFVDFYIDDLYLGTNNAFVPTRGGKFFIAHWYPNNRNHLWNGGLFSRASVCSKCFQHTWPSRSMLKAMSWSK